VHGEVSGELQLRVRHLLDLRRLERDGRVLLDVEEVGALEVIIALGDAGVDALGVDVL
jgi:hypothetical protein